MRAITVLQRSFEVPFLPDDLGDALRRRLREVAGVTLLGLTVAAVAALATWSVRDPSLSHATSAPVRNLLGMPGAITADLLMQLIGLASIALIVPIAAWGWRLTSHVALARELLRMCFWLVGAILATGFAACMPRTPSWPLPTGLGGVIGDLVLRVPAAVIGPLGGAAQIIIAVILGCSMVASVAIASGVGLHRSPTTSRIRKHEADAEDREGGTAISIGMIVHGLLSLKALMTRLAARRMPRKSAPAPSAAVEPRMEPAFVGQTEMAANEPAIEEAVKPERSPAKPRPARAARRSSEGYALPSLNLLASYKPNERPAPNQQAIQDNATALESVLDDFGVRGQIINARPGPVVTLYELEPAPGIKSSRVIGLADDIARSMSAVSARVAVVSGRNVIGIELPNATREKVYLRELLAADEYTNSPAKLPLCLGKTIGGETVIVDLARMPHLLIAGTTGSGKSVAINTMILSLLYRLRPDQCRLIMVDPKMLELSVYDGIPHLLTPVVTDPKKAVVALKWAVREMEDRYKKMAKLGVRNIDGFNARLAEAKAKGEGLSRTVHTGYDKDTGEAIYEREEFDLDYLPYLVVIVDEMADLMMVAGKDIEGAIQRLAQMARAAGIHVVLATQRPSVDVITGTIKANFPTRISFQVTSKIDSRTILGEQGAEQLLGQGDMLYMAGGGRISRVHGPFVSDDEVEKIVRHLKAQGAPQYLEDVTAGGEEDEEDSAVFDATGMGAAGDATDLYQQAVQIVLRDRKASTSYIQRRLQIGYNRAASIMERMEQEGVVGQPNHAGKREILIEGGNAEPA
jgi:DNA segregation ATPase FtsK/SpoIIIE, S-DNA-T family